MGLFSWIFGSNDGSSRTDIDEYPEGVDSRPDEQPTVTVAGFSLSVPEAIRENEGYLYMNHGDKYTLRLKNKLPRRCDAETHVDGQHVGTWRIDARSYVDIERPVNSKKRFTFYAVDTPEAEAANIEEDEKTGHIQVIFKPKLVDQREAPADVRFSRRRAGGTGLSGQSRQRFQKATPIEYDESSVTEVNARLVTEDDPDKPHPLGRKSNDVPSPA